MRAKPAVLFVTTDASGGRRTPRARGERSRLGRQLCL